MVTQINNTFVQVPTATGVSSNPHTPDNAAVQQPTGQNNSNVAEAVAVSKPLEASVSDINDFVQSIQRNIQFSVSEATGRTIIEVYDADTEELIRQIPSEDMQRIAEALAEQLKEGLLFNTSV